MMEEVTPRSNVEYIPPLPPKVKQRQTTFTQITCDEKLNGFDATDGRASIDSLSSMHSLVLNSKTPSTVFIAASQTDRPANTPSTDASTNGPHVVTIRINTNSEITKAPKISSVHLKSDVNFETLKISERRNNSLVTINVDDSRPKILEKEEIVKTDKPPFIYCNSFHSMSNVVMSSGQCSPSDTLDSGTCSDLDGTPPPLPKKKTSKTNSNKKVVSVTIIGTRNGSAQNEVDFEDNDSNISYDSLNSSELNGSVQTDESHVEYISKKENHLNVPEPPELPMFTLKLSNKDSNFLPQGLLRDIRDHSGKITTPYNETKHENQDNRQNNETSHEPKESMQLTSFRLVSQMNSQSKPNTDRESSPPKTPLISESTYEDRQKEDKIKQEKMCYSSHYFDTDKYYDFHLNEKQFDDDKSVSSVSVSAKSECNIDSDVEYFAGVKDYKNEEPPSTIRSSKGTIRGVKNRVRAGIATFLQIQNTTKIYKEKDANKVVLYTTTMGIVRNTYQRCVHVKKILQNLLVKYEERDVFMSTEYQDEIRDRMRSDDILVPQLFVDGHHIGDADTVEKLNESGELRKMLKPYKSLDACTTCQVCGGFRLLPCRICNGSKKSLHRNHFTAEFSRAEVHEL
ncbi:hypothetical protein ACJJTC_007040 [Scirpophaga incertulas]